MRNFRLALIAALLLAFPAHASNIQSNVYSAPGGTANALLTNSAVSVVSGQHNLQTIILYNPNASVEYIQLFDALAANVTVGTTVPKMVVPIPASSTIDLPIENSAQITFFTGIVVAATTTATGASAPGTGITANIIFQ
jgi:hypothetical protein